ncbi:MAG: hypothetical protein LC660_14215 [Desulfobacteraceae bacterium]|nr:hypothetical protein [Desulfobacteraceae bacterium]
MYFDLKGVNSERVSIIDLDNYGAMTFINFLKTETEKVQIRKHIQTRDMSKEETADLFDRFSSRINEIAEKRIAYLEEEHRDLQKMEKELNQIIQGSMIPTFIIDNVVRASGVIKHMRDFARQPERDLKKININDPITDVFKVLGHQLSVHSIEKTLELSDNLPEIRAEHNRLEQVFINLVTNAIDAMEEKALRTNDAVEKMLTIKTFARNGYVVATVSDTGVGMSETVKDKIFEPFFTTKVWDFLSPKNWWQSITAPLTLKPVWGMGLCLP